MHPNILILQHLFNQTHTSRWVDRLNYSPHMQLTKTPYFLQIVFPSQRVIKQLSHAWKDVSFVLDPICTVWYAEKDDSFTSFLSLRTKICGTHDCFWMQRGRSSGWHRERGKVLRWEAAIVMEKYYLGVWCAAGRKLKSRCPVTNILAAPSRAHGRSTGPQNPIMENIASIPFFVRILLRVVYRPWRSKARAVNR